MVPVYVGDTLVNLEDKIGLSGAVYCFLLTKLLDLFVLHFILLIGFEHF